MKAVLTGADADLRKDIEYLEIHQDAGHADPASPAFEDYLTDVQTTIANGHRVRYPYHPPATDDERDSFLVSQSALAATSLSEILSLLKAPPTPVLSSGVWTFTQGGTKFQGRSPMPASFVDTSAAWGVAVSDLRDADGKPAAPGATIAYSVDDADVVALTDNGDGTGTVAPGPLAVATLPATTAIHATITNPDGNAFTVDDAITVVAGDAVTGTFAFTAPAA